MRVAYDSDVKNYKLPHHYIKDCSMRLLNVDLPHGLCYCDADASKASKKFDSITCANIVGPFLAISCTRPY